MGLLLIMACHGPAEAAPAQRGLPDTNLPAPFGVNIHFTDAPKAELDLLRDGGFRLIRMDFFWQSVERRPGSYEFGAYDMLVANLARRNIRPLFILDYGNPLYDSPAGTVLSPHTPEGWAAYARFCAAAVTHYRGRGVIWELWNEPNGFWKPRPNVDDYAGMALAAAQAMRAADPGCTIVAPGVSGFDPAFVERVFQRGLLPYLDAVSVHPYRDSPPETALADFHRLRQLIDRYASSGQRVPFACSEWGYSAVALPEEQQGQYLARQWLVNLLAGSRFSIWYDWKDDGTDPTNREHHFGTVRPDLQPKPAYRAARALARGLNPFRLLKRLDLGRPDDFILLFGTGEQQMLAAWTTGAPHDLFLPRGVEISRATDWQDETMTVPMVGGSPRLHLGPGPCYLRLRAASEELALRAAWRADMESTSVDGGASSGVRVSLTVRNPTSRRIPLAARLIPPVPLEGGWTTPPPGLLEPKKEVQLRWVGQWPLRADQEVSVPIDVRLGPASGRETVTFEVRNALRPEIQWRAGGADLLIHNRSGAAFAGEVRLTVGGRAVRKPVRLAQGETVTRVPLDLTGEEPLSGGLYNLRDEYLAPVEARRRQPIPVETPGGGWQIHPDGSPDVRPREVSLSVTGSPGPDAPFPRAVRCDFDLGQGWKFLRVTLPHPPPLGSDPKRLGMWVYGDGGGGSVRCRFTDAQGQTFQPGAGEPVTWTGWHWVSLPLDGRQAGFWGGPADGVVHGPIRWDTLFLFDPLGEAPRRGTLYFTGLTVEY